MSQSLTDKTISGLNWSFLGTYGNAIINTIVGIVLARLLTPQDFGLIGMVYIFTGLADLFATLGMGESVIRIKNLNDNYIRVATTLTITASVLIYLVFYFSSPFIAAFYNEPKIIPIIKVLSFLFLIKAVATISYSRLQRNLDFKTIMVLSITNSVTYGITSSVLAIRGFGVWSLVYGNLAASIISAFLTLRKSPPSLKPLLKKNEFKELAGFGSGVTLSNILLYGSSNVDYLIIGKFINPSALGLYTRAFNLMTESISKISGGIYSVLFPAFAAAQNEKQKLRIAYLRTIKTLSYFVFPVLAVMMINADYIIKGLYGVKWAGAVPVFRILAFGGILRATLPYSGAIAHATGRVYAEVFQQLVYFLILGGFALYTIKFGIEGIAFAVVAALVWMFFAQSYLAIKIIDSSWKEFLYSLIPAFANLIVMVCINIILVFLIEKFFFEMKAEIKLIIMLILNAVAFLSVIIFLPFSIKGDAFDWLIEKYKKYIPSIFIKFYLLFNTQK